MAAYEYLDWLLDYASDLGAPKGAVSWVVTDAEAKVSLALPGRHVEDIAPSLDGAALCVLQAICPDPGVQGDPRG